MVSSIARENTDPPRRLVGPAIDPPLLTTYIHIGISGNSTRAASSELSPSDTCILPPARFPDSAACARPGFPGTRGAGGICWMRLDESGSTGYDLICRSGFGQGVLAPALGGQGRLPRRGARVRICLQTSEPPVGA